MINSQRALNTLEQKIKYSKQSDSPHKRVRGGSVAPQDPGGILWPPRYHRMTGTPSGVTPSERVQSSLGMMN